MYIIVEDCIIVRSPARQASASSSTRRAWDVICLEGTKGFQGMGVVSNNWFDCVLLSIVYMLKPSC